MHENLFFTAQKYFSKMSKVNRMFKEKHECVYLRNFTYSCESFFGNFVAIKENIIYLPY